MITRKLGLGLLTLGLLVGLSACTDKGDDCDTAAGEDCEGGADADTDTDADSDTDADADADAFFEPYAMGFNFRTGFDDGGFASVLATDGSTSEPFVEVTVFEEEYFTVGADERYTCTYFALMTEIAVDDMGVADLFYGAEIELSPAGEGGAEVTDCESFNPEDWGDVHPGPLLNKNRFAVGFGPMDADFTTALKTAVEGGGQDWAVDWEPYVFGQYMSFTQDAGGDFAENASNLGYAFGLEVEDDMSLSVDSEGQTIVIEAGSATEMPDPAYISSSAYWLPNVTNFE